MSGSPHSNPLGTVGGTQQLPRMVRCPGGHNILGVSDGNSLLFLHRLSKTTSSDPQHLFSNMAMRSGGQQSLALSSLPRQHWPSKSSEIAARQSGGHGVFGSFGLSQSNTLHTKLQPGMPGTFAHTFAAFCPQTSPKTGAVTQTSGLISSGPPFPCR